MREPEYDKSNSDDRANAMEGRVGEIMGLSIEELIRSTCDKSCRSEVGGWVRRRGGGSKARQVERQRQRE